ncbi:phospholipase D-like domain-containing protein [Trichlorobacter ammonificans]|uniref:Cardiolipin synthetase n=1 Tax=Trichlorobacter ammonificans TaxID=2916410 RepID=A0ABN8HHU6_9BACT|nr:phospholipase D-like domain-containing protein [Trichlorobacter ammonificans]CAH2031125.1 Cardiolipin synthetase [Trichlorobacter ammonificans]
MAPERNRAVRSSRAHRLLRRWGRVALSRTVPVEQVRLHATGADFFAAYFAALASARTYICLEYYIIRADRTGNRLAEELTAARRRGVQVFLIYDYIGCLDTPESFFRGLRHHGVHCLPFNRPSFRRGIRWFDRRDHRKLTIIDDSLAFLGGLNVADEYAGIAQEHRRFRDVGFSLSGPAVVHLTDLFQDIWRLETGQPPRLPHPVHHAPPQLCLSEERRISLVSGGPHQLRSTIRTVFRGAMALAASELLIANPYFVPGPLILRSLLRAARRGVTIRLLLPARSDVPIVRLISRSTYRHLLDAGIEIYELEQELLHAKLMLIDGALTVIGSANLDQRSFHRNFEINAIVHCRSFGSQIRELFAGDLYRSRRITAETHGQRGMLVRLLERLLRPFSWFL